MADSASRGFGLGGEETKAILERSKYFEECRHVANFDPWWLSFPVIGWLAFGYRTYHLDDMTEAVGYAWVSACDQQWRPEQAGGPHWDRKAMATKFDRELKRRLPDHMS